MTIMELKALLAPYDETINVEVYVNRVADMQEIVNIDASRYGVVYLMVEPKQS